MADEQTAPAAHQPPEYDPAAPPTDPFRIFRCWDGERVTAYDPMKLSRDLGRNSKKLAGTDLVSLWQAAHPAKEPLPDGSLSPLTDEELDAAEAAQDLLDGVIRAAFHFKPFDDSTGDGLLSQEVRDQASAFFRWLEKKNQSTGG